MSDISLNSQSLKSQKQKNKNKVTCKCRVIKAQSSKGKEKFIKANREIKQEDFSTGTTEATE